MQIQAEVQVFGGATVTLSVGKNLRHALIIHSVEMEASHHLLILESVASQHLLLLHSTETEHFYKL